MENTQPFDQNTGFKQNSFLVFHNNRTKKLNVSISHWRDSNRDSPCYKKLTFFLDPNPALNQIKITISLPRKFLTTKQTHTNEKEREGEQTH